MKLPHLSLVFWLCISYVNCYFYPVCYPNNNGIKSDIFDLKHTFQDVVNNLKSKIFNAKTEAKTEYNNNNNNKELYSYITKILLDFIKFYNYYLQDINWDEFPTEYTSLHPYPYIHILQKKKKVKTDGRLYLLFIGGTLTVYLLLYVYFSKKLATFYQSSIKKQYINNIKKIFKQK